MCKASDFYLRKFSFEYLLKKRMSWPKYFVIFLKLSRQMRDNNWSQPWPFQILYQPIIRLCMFCNTHSVVLTSPVNRLDSHTSSTHNASIFPCKVGASRLVDSAHFTNTTYLFLDPFFIIKLKETQISSSSFSHYILHLIL